MTNSIKKSGFGTEGANYMNFINCRACQNKQNEACIKNHNMLKVSAIASVRVCEAPCSDFIKKDRIQERKVMIEQSEKIIQKIFIKKVLYDKIIEPKLIFVDIVGEIWDVKIIAYIKALSYQTGKPDVYIALKNDKWNGIAFEFKKDKTKKLSAEQKQTAKALYSQNIITYKVYDYNNALYLLYSYMNNETQDGYLIEGDF